MAQPADSRSISGFLRVATSEIAECSRRLIFLLAAVCPWVGSLTSLCIRFLISKMEHNHTSGAGVKIVLFLVIVSGGSWEQGWAKQAQNVFWD